MERKRVGHNNDDYGTESMPTKVPKLEKEHVTSVTIDTNVPSECISYRNVETTDYYRKGRPYKLLCYPEKSCVTVKFNIEYHPSPKVLLMLNHCRTNCHGKVDIIVNDTVLVNGFQEARWDNFGEQNFNIPSDCLKPGENVLMIRLSKGSHGVYWLSDLRLDINYSL